jgi:hypothetical protein
MCVLQAHNRQFQDVGLIESPRVLTSWFGQLELVSNLKISTA